MEDSEIISLFFARSEQAVAELDRQYGAAVKKTAANILPDRLDAEECVNDTYLRVWNSIPPQRPNPLVSFVCKIARNLALDRYRSSRAEKRNGSLLTASGQPDTWRARITTRPPGCTAHGPTSASTFSRKDRESAQWQKTIVGR